MAAPTTVLLGVRHHSPACARVVGETIRELRPARVLIEGPADFSARIGELLLGHTPPVALYSYLRTGERSTASFTPFCEYSPEWVALHAAEEIGAEPVFIDLPAWHPAFDGLSNRYGDAERRYALATDRLCAAFAVDSVDALWDHLVELPAERITTEALAGRLDDYFEALRSDTEPSASDAEREEYMLSWIRWADAQSGSTVVITGGFHQPALRRGLVETGIRAEGAARPDVPVLYPEKDVAAQGTFVIPYSDRRLDAFTGYQSGMPSPGYYRRLWRDGAESAADWVVRRVIDRLRGARLAVSSADLVSAGLLTRGLADVRGHVAPGRLDVLDGLVGALVTDDLPAEPPWTTRGPLRPGAHPAIVAMVEVLTGDVTGRLHRDTPMPPLVGAVEAELDLLALSDGDHVLELGDPADQRRSALLHRLRVLDIPGVHCAAGPGDPADVRLTESWTVRRDDRWRPALIEAGAKGAGPMEAAAFVLTGRLRTADVSETAGLLLDVLVCALGGLIGEVLDVASAGIAGAHDLRGIARLGRTSLGLWRHGDLFGAAHTAALLALARAATTRAIDLLAATTGAGRAPDGAAEAVVLVRDVVRHGQVAEEERRDLLDAVGALATRDTPAIVRGAATGLGWASGSTDGADAAARRPGPTELGEWLTGLFTVARAEVIEDRNLMRAIDGELAAMSEDGFLVALPALREAFEHFPPRERERVAELVLAVHGHWPDPHTARELLRAPSDPVAGVRATRREERVAQALAEEGLR